MEITNSWGGLRAPGSTRHGDVTKKQKGSATNIISATTVVIAKNMPGSMVKDANDRFKRLHVSIYIYLYIIDTCILTNSCIYIYIIPSS